MNSNFNNLNKEDQQNDLKYILNVLYKTQNQEQIIHNILNGKKYLRLYLTNNSDKYFVFEKGAIIKDMIPKFKKTDIYIPFIEKGSLNDYVENYTELKELVINKIEDKKISIDIPKTAINFREKESEIKLTQTHNIRLKKNKKREESINNYYLIYNFLKENYPYTDKSNSAFYLELDLKFIDIHASNFNFTLNDLSFIFFIPESFYRLREVPLLKKLIKKESGYRTYLYDKVDLNKSIEFIKNYNQIKNF